jgi:hypothetical protein
MNIEVDNDIVYLMGPYTSGKYKISFRSYTRSGGGFYYNTLLNFAGGASNWGCEFYGYPNGDFEIDNGDGGVVIAAGTYTHDAWILHEIYIDLDADLARFYLDGVLIVEWQWSSAGFLSLNATNFYGWGDIGGVYFVDNYKLEQNASFPAGRLQKKSVPPHLKTFVGPRRPTGRHSHSAKRFVPISVAKKTEIAKAAVAARRAERAKKVAKKSATVAKKSATVAKKSAPVAKKSATVAKKAEPVAKKHFSFDHKFRYFNKFE